MIQFDDHIFADFVGEKTTDGRSEFLCCRGGGGCAGQNTSIGRGRERMVEQRPWPRGDFFCFFVIQGVFFGTILVFSSTYI